MKQYGKFQSDNSFKVADANTPRPWYNYIFNDDYVACVSQIGTGEGFVQDPMGRRAPLVANRRVYICEGTADWWLAGEPFPKGKTSKCEAIHRPGKTDILRSNRGIESEWSLSAPIGLKGELWTLTLANKTKKTRKLRVLAFCATDVDGPYRIQSYNTATAGFSKKARGVVVRAADGFGTGKMHESAACFSARPAPDAFDARLNAFRGVYDSEQAPAAVLRNGGRCANTDCIGEKCCMALEHDIELAPGGKAEIKYCVQYSQTVDEAAMRKTADAFFAAPESDAFLSDTLSLAKFETPNKEFNALASTWLPTEARLGAHWARVRHNGYRDLLSDTDCLATVDPLRARQELLRILSYQYSNGYAPRTFIDGAVMPRNFADCCSGVAPTVLDIVLELGDKSLLDEIVAFNDGSKASVWEHARRAAEWLWNFRGRNGLVKIWGGDWNDCMDKVGIGGKGTSVWLTCAAIRALKAVAELAAMRGDAAARRTALRRADALAKAVNGVGWDGEWYRYAFKDDGGIVGSAKNKEGALHLIVQLWAVFAGIVPKDRLEKILRAIDTKLPCKWGTLIMDKGYSTIDPTLGFIGTKAPGIHENGGVYLHTMCWKILFEAMLGRKRKLWETLQCTLPVADGGQRRPCEPYVMSNSIFGPQTGYRSGTPGQSWRCASGPWLLKAVLAGVFGFAPKMDGLYIKPCLPEQWCGSRVVKTFRGAVYDVLFKSSDASRITVDGAPHDPAKPLPCKAGKTYLIVIG